MRSAFLIIVFGSLGFAAFQSGLFSGGVESKQETTNSGNGQNSVVHQKAAPYLDVVFYNVENLFDTIDLPGKFDEEFTPASDKRWNTERYQTKLEHLNKVITAACYSQTPDLLGLCEVENRKVLSDLAHSAPLSEESYGIIHHESPDARGIDVALLYKKRKGGFQPDGSGTALNLHFPADTAYTSRDILYVSGTIGQGNKRSRLHIFVNHWPSRRGGLQASEPRRIVAASRLRQAVDSIQQAEGGPARILIMGDFNDEPDNNSISQTLGAAQNCSATNGDMLCNLMGPADAEGLGTYNYRGNWNMLDHFIISTALLSNKGWNAETSTASAFQQDWMMYKDERFGPTPSRTYGGPNYYAGYSDHLPIRMRLQYHK